MCAITCAIGDVTVDKLMYTFELVGVVEGSEVVGCPIIDAIDVVQPDGAFNLLVTSL